MSLPTSTLLSPALNLAFAHLIACLMTANPVFDARPVDLSKWRLYHELLFNRPFPFSQIIAAFA